MIKKVTNRNKMMSSRSRKVAPRFSDRGAGSGPPGPPARRADTAEGPAVPSAVAAARAVASLAKGRSSIVSRWTQSNVAGVRNNRDDPVGVQPESRGVSCPVGCIRRRQTGDEVHVNQCVIRVMKTPDSREYDK